MRKTLAFVSMLMVLVFCLAGIGAAEFNPGTYSVEMWAHNGNIKLDVTFSADRIEKVELVEHRESLQLGDVAIEMIAAEIIEKQSLNVDTIAGATISSAVARAAITQAVKDAGGDPAAMQIAEPEDTAVLPDENVDIVVVGAGIAGMAAATEAADLGLDVILVEQLGILGGSSMRAGSIQGADTSVLAKYGMTFTKEQHYARLTAPLGPNQHPDTLDMEYCAVAPANWGANVDWLVELGVEFDKPWSGFWHGGPGGQRIAWQFIKVMQERFDEKGTDYRMNTKAESLIMEDGVVKGIVATAPNGTQYKIFAKGVVLATGGYLANKELVAKYLPGFENGTYDVSIGCDGSGLLMALDAGANTKAMDNAGMHALACVHRGISRSLTMPAHCGAIAVNSKGERFADENAPYADLTAAVKAQGDVWLLMDSVTFEAPVVKDDTAAGNPDMYLICDTLEELANELGIDYEGLMKTIERYGEMVRNGVDEDFGKHKEGLVGDFSKGPYYGVKTVIENHTVYGGVDTDNDMRVLNTDGEIIEGLLGAGEFACFNTPGRGPLAESLDMGRIAARTVKAAIDAQ